MFLLWAFSALPCPLRARVTRAQPGRRPDREECLWRVKNNKPGEICAESALATEIGRISGNAGQNICAGVFFFGVSAFILSVNL